MNNNILEINNLCVTHKKFKLDNISFTLEKGYVMGLIGTNGAGKSTIIRAIINSIKKNSGEIKVFGLDSTKDYVQIRDRIGFVNDENVYPEELTIDSVKKLISPLYSKWNDEDFKLYLKKFNLDPKIKIKKLSKGMKMKFAIAVALSHEAELIIMDEPTAGLDPVFRREMLQVLHSLMQDENKGILFSTHITSDLDNIADYITFIQDGKMMFSQSREDINDKYVVVKGSKDELDKMGKELLIGYTENAYGFEGLSVNKNAIREIMGDKIIIEKATLEDIMVNYSVASFKHD